MLADGRLVFDAMRLPVLRFDAAPRALRVRFVQPSGSVDAHEVDRAPAATRWVVRFDLAVETVGDGDLVVTADERTRTLPARWVLAPEAHPRVREVVRLRREGKLDQALARLEDQMRTATGDARRWLEAERARLRHRQGDLNAAVTFMSSAAAQAETAQRRLEASNHWQNAAYYALRGRDYTAAEERLRRAAAAAGTDEYSQLRIDWARGRHAHGLGRLGLARTLYTRALGGAVRTADTRTLVGVDLDLAEIEGALGLHGEARRRLERQPPLGGRDGWLQRKGRAWVELLTMRSCEVRPDFARLRPELDEIAASASADTDVRTRADTHLERAIAAHLDGDPSTARAALNEAGAIHAERGLDPRLADLLEAELRLAEGRPDEAITYLDRVAADARATFDLRYEWQALHALGRAHRVAGDLDAAFDSWREASAAAARLAVQAPLHEGRAGVLGRRERLVGDMVDALVAQQRAPAAFEVVEQHRAPVLRHLHTDANLDDPPEGWSTRVSTWQIRRERLLKMRERCDSVPLPDVPGCHRDVQSQERRARQALEAATALLDPSPGPGVSAAELLAALEPGHALMAHHPKVDDRTCAVSWHRFLLADGVVRYRPPGADTAAWAGLLAERTHVYVVDGGPPLETTAQTSRIPWAGWLLRETEPAEGAPLVVADPQRDLPASAAAARDVAAASEATLLEGRHATRGAFARAAATARWIHYDGHGVLDPDDPWEAHLPLADGRLTISDILTAPMRPRTVVLAGCETALASDLGGRERVSLAHAFLLAGARTVVATDRRLPDADSARFVRLFHALGGPERPGPAFGEAVAALRRVGDPAWQGWRLFGRP